MSFVQISNVYTADPANVWVPKSAFITSDAFAVVLIVQVGSSLVQGGMRSDTVFQIVNPQLDPLGGAWWYWDGSWTSQTIDRPSIDKTWSNVPFSFTHFARWWSWSSWANAVMYTQPKVGVFSVRGHIDVRSSNLFARSGEFSFKVS